MVSEEEKNVSKSGSEKVLSRVKESGEVIFRERYAMASRVSMMVDE